MLSAVILDVIDPIAPIVTNLTSLGGSVTVAILAVGALIIGLAAAAGAALKWGPALVAKFFKR